MCLFRGFFPARVMVRLVVLAITYLQLKSRSKRTFLRAETENKAIQIQAIGLSLYEPVDGLSEDKIGNEVIRTQWLYVAELLTFANFSIIAAVLIPANFCWGNAF